MDDAATQTILAKFLDLQPVLDERARRLWAATEARALGRGGIVRVAEATGMSRITIAKGLRQLGSGVEASDRQRSPGGDRKRTEDWDPGLAGALERLVNPATRGDPTGPLRWTSLSAAHLAEPAPSRSSGRACPPPCRPRCRPPPDPAAPGARRATLRLLQQSGDQVVDGFGIEQTCLRGASCSRCNLPCFGFPLFLLGKTKRRG